MITQLIGDYIIHVHHVTIYLITYIKDSHAENKTSEKTVLMNLYIFNFTLHFSRSTISRTILLLFLLGFEFVMYI